MSIGSSASHAHDPQDFHCMSRASAGDSSFRDNPTLPDWVRGAERTPAELCGPDFRRRVEQAVRILLRGCRICFLSLWAVTHSGSLLLLVRSIATGRCYPWPESQRDGCLSRRWSHERGLSGSQRFGDGLFGGNGAGRGRVRRPQGPPGAGQAPERVSYRADGQSVPAGCPSRRTVGPDLGIGDPSGQHA